MITKEYANTRNGGKERISRNGNMYFINSYVPKTGWIGERKISRADAIRCMAYTNAPADVVAEIIGDD